MYIFLNYTLLKVTLSIISTSATLEALLIVVTTIITRHHKISNVVAPVRLELHQSQAKIYMYLYTCVLSKAGFELNEQLARFCKMP